MSTVRGESDKLTVPRSGTRSPAPSSGPLRSHLRERVAELGFVLAGFFAIVVVVAGGAALALLGWPSHSATYFSWGLGEPPAAATVGGLYLASVVTFAEASTRSRHEARALTVGVLGLAVPTLVFTAVHHDVFDWSRPQAVAWVALFLSAPTAVVLDIRTPTTALGVARATTPTRFLLAVVSTLFAGLALALWTSSSTGWLATRSPVPLVGLTGDYLGAWCLFVAGTSVAAAVRGHIGDVRTVGVLLGSVAGGVTLAMVRTLADLGPNAAVCLCLLGLAASMAVALLNASRKALASENVVSEAAESQNT